MTQSLEDKALKTLRILSDNDNSLTTNGGLNVKKGIITDFIQSNKQFITKGNLLYFKMSLMPLSTKSNIGSFEEPWNNILANNLSVINADIDNLHIEKKFVLGNNALVYDGNSIHINTELKVNKTNNLIKFNQNEVQHIFNIDEPIIIYNSIIFIHFYGQLFDKDITIIDIPNNTTIKIYFVDPNRFKLTYVDVNFNFQFDYHKYHLIKMNDIKKIKLMKLNNNIILL
jgi:hypothetical protein